MHVLFVLPSGSSFFQDNIIHKEHFLSGSVQKHMLVN